MNNTLINSLPQDTKDPAKLFTRLMIQKMHTNFGEGSYSKNDIDRIEGYGKLMFGKSDKVEKIIAYVNLFYALWIRNNKPQKSLLDKCIDGKQYNFID